MNSNEIVTFTLTRDLEQRLKEQNIYFTNQHGVGSRIGTRYNFSKQVVYGKNAVILNGTELVNIGSFSYSHSPCIRGLSIGNYCSLAANIRYFGTNHPYERFSSSAFTYDTRFQIFADRNPGISERFQPRPNPHGRPKPAQIGHDVWIGGHVLIANGITIGTGAVVAAGAVVVKDVKPYTIVGGTPARELRKRFPDEISERLLASRWYEYDFSQFGSINVNDDIESVTTNIENLLRSEALTPLEITAPLVTFLDDQ